MSVQFYIKDENGIFLSIDGKVKYTCLEGQKLYNFLKTKDGRNRCFHVEIDEDGNKIGIEATPEFIKAEESEKIMHHISKDRKQNSDWRLSLLTVTSGTMKRMCNLLKPLQMLRWMLSRKCSKQSKSRICIRHLNRCRWTSMTSYIIFSLPKSH